MPAETLTKVRLVSADSHVVEPRDLWLTRLPERFRDQAPQVISRDDGDFFVVPGTGMSPKPLGTEGAMIERKISGTIRSATGYRFEQQRPGAYDPAARLHDQDREGVECEVVYPGWLIVHSIPDFELKAACVRAYNEWLFEDFCSHAPTRLVGAAVLPVGDGPIDRGDRGGTTVGGAWCEDVHVASVGTWKGVGR